MRSARYTGVTLDEKEKPMGNLPGTHSGMTLKTIRKRIADGTGKCACDSAREHMTMLW